MLALIHSPWVTIIIGLMMIVTSMEDVGQSFSSALTSNPVTGSHGIALYALLLVTQHILVVLPGLFIGIQHLVEGSTKEVKGWVRRLLESPVLEIFSGIVLVVISLIYADDAILSDLAKPGITSNHALFIFGLFSILRNLALTLEGLDLILPDNNNHKSRYIQRISLAFNTRLMNGVMATILFTAPLMAMSEEFFNSLMSAKFNYHHGTFLIAINQLCRAIPDIYDSFDYLEKVQN